MENILDKIKLLLGITDDSKDDILKFHLEMVIRDVLNYTNRSKVPEALWCTIARLVRLSINSALGYDYEAPIDSLSESGRSVSFSTQTMKAAAIEDERKNIYVQLNRFKLPFRQE
jgi:hypothetical protein